MLSSVQSSKTKVISPQASIASGIPSLSESRSNASGTPSISESNATHTGSGAGRKVNDPPLPTAKSKISNSSLSIHPSKVTTTLCSLTLPFPGFACTSQILLKDGTPGL